MAKLHVRYMVGGHAHGLAARAAVPLRVPGASGRAAAGSCEAIGTRWNISLFHYRNHGSDYGRVLAGVQVAPADAEEFARHLRELRLRRTPKRPGNPAYRMFLGRG